MVLVKDKSWGGGRIRRILTSHVKKTENIPGDYPLWVVADPWDDTTMSPF